ncbi:MAG: hypothetical protein ACRYGI_11500 [Janthinobacterium lividum]
MFMILTQTTADMFNGRKPARVNMTNRKPFRTAEQKKAARANATKRDDGTYRTTAPYNFHREIPVVGK